MKLSTKGRYGIHAMFDLAENAGGAPQSIKAIAERQNIPEPYLSQIINTLRKDELVKSVRGAQGGYQLARTPQEITVKDILWSLEGDVRLTECLIESDACAKAGACPTRLVWQKLSAGIRDILDSITLQDMLDDKDRMLNTEA